MADRLKRSWWIALPVLGVLILGTVGAYETGRLEVLTQRLGWLGEDQQEACANEHCEGHDHDHAAHRHDHEHGAHGHAHHDDEDHEADHIEISEQAQRNIGLVVSPLKAATFHRAVTVPGMVIEKPGRSDVQLTAPLAGVVTRIYPIQGEAVEPGQPVCDIRLTHEEVVQAQTDLLKTIEELDVVRREIERLEKITNGIIPQKNVLDRKYEQQKLEALDRTQVQALLLHGLSEKQIQSIREDRRLLQTVTIRAPQAAEGRITRWFELEELQVGQGQHVQVGQSLCVLGDHASLYIEGQAFESEAELLGRAAKEQWAVQAAFDRTGKESYSRGDLRVSYVSNKVDPESRTYRFYVELPNEITREVVSGEGQRFIEWRFKPGQRVQLDVPVEQWPDRLVLPLEAVVQEGPESFIFVQKGDHFERRPVHVEYKDARSAVLAADQGVLPGERVALTGAYQLHLAIKNKSGGAVDPHAGHNH